MMKQKGSKKSTTSLLERQVMEFNEKQKIYNKLKRDKEALMKNR